VNARAPVLTGANKRKLIGLLTLIETIGLESEADLRKRNGSRIGLMVETARAAREVAKVQLASLPQLLAALEDCANRFERCCIHSGSDKGFAAHAVEDYRALITTASTGKS
jgi:hypothetical protein